ncbi:hypothetical protein F444_18712 [Phytophthora nicotianae P1976]|uniref:Uncharacterized protein n=1 Tax=Phytophthora nicotianae P1976 TaxID=1317066 RepID=A0A080ZAG4_PHYNI|nr:hypothetical protein F444_18712 [Phytophthora nicotianae P1976]
MRGTFRKAFGLIFPRDAMTGKVLLYGLTTPTWRHLRLWESPCPSPTRSITTKLEASCFSAFTTRLPWPLRICV